MGGESCAQKSDASMTYVDLLAELAVLVLVRGDLGLRQRIVLTIFHSW